MSRLTRWRKRQHKKEVRLIPLGRAYDIKATDEKGRDVPFLHNGEAMVYISPIPTTNVAKKQ